MEKGWALYGKWFCGDHRVTHCQGEAFRATLSCPMAKQGDALPNTRYDGILLPHAAVFLIGEVWGRVGNAGLCPGRASRCYVPAKYQSVQCRPGVDIPSNPNCCGGKAQYRIILVMIGMKSLRNSRANCRHCVPGYS